MRSIPQARFNEFLHDIEPSETTKGNAKTAHIALRDFLKQHEQFKQYHVRTFLSGSYKRNTAIRPKTKDGEIDRPDIDIIVIMNCSLQSNPKEVIDFVHQVLQREYPEIRKQQRSVGIETSKADMDVVALIEEGDSLYIPDRKLETWLETNPEMHTEWTIEKNSVSDGRFKPLVKMMKWWRRNNRTISKKPKGFVIECIVADCMDYEEEYYGELFVRTLEEIEKKYRPYVDAGLVPRIEDPGVTGNSVTDHISSSSFKSFVNKAYEHAVLGRQALLEEDSEEATVIWKKILGDRFPRTPSKRSDSTLDSAVSAKSPVFPNHPIKPNKPRGFA